MPNRRITTNYNTHYFKPQGIPLRQLDTTDITKEELEALKLRYIDQQNQTQAAQSMEISQSQYQRDLSKVLTKITDALINGKAIKIED